jgi:hypothetical protein
MTMKKIFTALCLAATLATGCTMSNEYGACKGLATEDEMDPSLHYSVSTYNVVLAVIFSETLLWPGLTAAFWLKCPDYRLSPPAGK